MASFALVGATQSAAVMMSAAKSEKKGLLDWLNDALEKGGFSETDPILQKDGANNGAPPKPVAAPKKGASPPKKQGGGGGFFGLGKK